MASRPVHVAVRVRPFLSTVDGDGEKARKPVVTSVEDSKLVLDNKYPFRFTHVLSEDATQADVYTRTVMPLVDRLKGGENVTVIVYGQTGAGKTFTLGSHASLLDTAAEHRGIIPRLVEQVFASPSGGAVTVDVQSVEVYNEEVLDMLIAPEDRTQRLSLHQEGSQWVVKGLSTASGLSTPSSVMDTIRSAFQSRIEAEMASVMSSRSHAICTLTVTQGGRSATVTFVDLAGSERLSKGRHDETRIRESIFINAGLLALGNVIASLANKRGKNGHVPYRDSKLTKLMQQSLGADSNVLFFGCIAPSIVTKDETLCTLRYATRASKVRHVLKANIKSRYLTLPTNRPRLQTGSVLTTEDPVVTQMAAEAEAEEDRQRKLEGAQAGSGGEVDALIEELNMEDTAESKLSESKLADPDPTAADSVDNTPQQQQQQQEDDVTRATSSMSSARRMSVERLAALKAEGDSDDDEGGQLAEPATDRTPPPQESDAAGNGSGDEDSNPTAAALGVGAGLAAVAAVGAAASLNSEEKEDKEAMDRDVTTPLVPAPPSRPPSGASSPRRASRASGMSSPRRLSVNTKSSSALRRRSSLPMHSPMVVQRPRSSDLVDPTTMVAQARADFDDASRQWDAHLKDSSFEACTSQGFKDTDAALASARRKLADAEAAVGLTGVSGGSMPSTPSAKARSQARSGMVAEGAVKAVDLAKEKVKAQIEELLQAAVEEDRPSRTALAVEEFAAAKESFSTVLSAIATTDCSIIPTPEADALEAVIQDTTSSIQAADAAQQPAVDAGDDESKVVDLFVTAVGTASSDVTRLSMAWDNALRQCPSTPQALDPTTGGVLAAAPTGGRPGSAFGGLPPPRPPTREELAGSPPTAPHPGPASSSYLTSDSSIMSLPPIAIDPDGIPVLLGPDGLPVLGLDGEPVPVIIGADGMPVPMFHMPNGTTLPILLGADGMAIIGPDKYPLMLGLEGLPTMSDGSTVVAVGPDGQPLSEVEMLALVSMGSSIAELRMSKKGTKARRMRRPKPDYGVLLPPKTPEGNIKPARVSRRKKKDDAKNLTPQQRKEKELQKAVASISKLIKVGQDA